MNRRPSSRASRFPETVAALSRFDPTLLELVRAGSSDWQLECEGYSIFDVSAVRTLAGRLDATDYTLERRNGRHPVGSNAALE